MKPPSARQLAAAAGMLLSAASGAAAEDWIRYELGPINGWASSVGAKGSLALQPLFYFNSVRGTYNNEGVYAPLPQGEERHFAQYQLLACYGVSERSDACVQSGAQKNYIKTAEHEASFTGLMDSNLFFRYRHIDEGKYMPETSSFFVGKLPTGKYRNGGGDKLGADIIGTGSYDAGYGLLFGKKLKPWEFHADVYYNVPFTSPYVDGAKTKYGNYARFDFIADYFFTKHASIMLEFNGYSQGPTRKDGAESPDSAWRWFSAMPAINLSNENVQALIGFQRTLSGRNTTALNTWVASVIYSF